MEWARRHVLAVAAAAAVVAAAAVAAAAVAAAAALAAAPAAKAAAAANAGGIRGHGSEQAWYVEARGLFERRKCDGYYCLFESTHRLSGWVQLLAHRSLTLSRYIYYIYKALPACLPAANLSTKPCKHTNTSKSPASRPGSVVAGHAEERVDQVWPPNIVRDRTHLAVRAAPSLGQRGTGARRSLGIGPATAGRGSGGSGGGTPPSGAERLDEGVDEVLLGFAAGSLVDKRQPFTRHLLYELRPNKKKQTKISIQTNAQANNTTSKQYIQNTKHNKRTCIQTSKQTDKTHELTKENKHFSTFTGRLGREQNAREAKRAGG